MGVVRALVAVALFGSPAAANEDGAERFRDANAQIVAGDPAGAIAGYRALAADGFESASLYWNWAQAAQAKGDLGQAVWALLRGRELDPGDARLTEEIEHVRDAASLDPAELAPEPLRAFGRLARRFGLGWSAVVLSLLSVVFHGVARRVRSRALPAAAWSLAALALGAATPVLLAGLARPVAVVVAPDAPLMDAASPTAERIATLRQGEAVPVLGTSRDYLEVEDSAGARGWVLAVHAWRLDEAPDAH